MGRFLNADLYVSTGQGLIGHNTYTYCLNNPVNLSDSTGEMATILVSLGASVIISGLSNAISTYISGGSIEEVLLSGVLGGVFGAIGYGVSFLGGMTWQGNILVRGVSTFVGNLYMSYLINGEITSNDVYSACIDTGADMLYSTMGYYWIEECVKGTIGQNIANAVYDFACDILGTWVYNEDSNTNAEAMNAPVKTRILSRGGNQITRGIAFHAM